jgi:hypothetical protein
MEASGWLHALATLNPGKILLMGLRADVNCLEERYVSCSCRESNPSSSAVIPKLLWTILKGEAVIVVSN